MKKLLFIFAIFAITLVFATPQNNYAKSKKALKEHVCTNACKDGKCVFKHGEKGHICGPECNAKINKSASQPILKEHVCTDACKNGAHVYVHGEKGHVCTDACLHK